MARVLDFSDGFTSASAPTAGSIFSTSGSQASPNSVVAANGITANGVGMQIFYMQGSGGAVDISANPQITAGTEVGALLILIGTSDTNTVKIDDSNGLSINGNFTMGNKDALGLVWNGSVWSEVFRREE